MLQDTLKYNPAPLSGNDSLHQATPLLGPLKPVLPDSLQQGIPPYADPQSKPSDSLFARLELNQFFRTVPTSVHKLHGNGKMEHTEKSMFSYHQLHATNLTPVVRNNQQFNWLTGVLILSFVIFTITQFLYSKRIKQIFRASLGRRYVNQLIREGSLFNERISIALMFIYFAMAAVFVFQGARYLLQVNLVQPELTFTAIFAGLLIYWFLKVALIRFLGFVFKTESSAYEYNLTGLIFLEITGLILLPLSLPAVFQNQALYTEIGLIIIALSIIFNITRGFLVGLYNTKFSLFYLILYLCTLEILPIAIVIKFFTNY